MFKGYYNLTSGMLTQQRNLNVVANNMTNVSTAGFKASRYTSSTFGEVMFNRVGNQDKENYTEIGNQSYIRATSEIVTDFTQGTLEPTGIPLDFAIEGDGFFAVRNGEGEVRYTRAGSFSLDEEGYLCYGGFGRVLGYDGEEIPLMTDKISGDEYGRLYTENGMLLGRLGVFSFDDEVQLEYNEEGFFVGGEGQAMDAPTVHWRYLERSNSDITKEMTEMLSAQRLFQSAATVSKIYDQLMTKATTELGRV